MSFTTPIALVCLLLIPYVAYMGWPRQRFRRARDITSLLLRVVILLAVILALAGAQLVQAVDRLAVVFLVDASDSMDPAARTAQLEYIQEAVKNKPIDDEWAIVAFGANASVERSFTTLDRADRIASTVVQTHTNIAGAIQTAVSMFPADANRRIVILSDGQSTLGDAEAKANLAAASGIEISYVHFSREPLPDVRVTALNTPSRVIEGQEFDVSVTIESDEDTPAVLRLFSGGEVVYERELNLRRGSNTHTLTQISESSGFLDFSARIDPGTAEDNFNQNNQLAAFSQVVGPPRVLLVSRTEEDILNLRPALEETGVRVDVIPPTSLPVNMSQLADYKSIIMSNVPATSLNTAQMELIDSYVKDLGGGLVFIGGPDTYGPGAYFQTKLEETLPLETQIKDQQRIPQLTIVYLIDRSGSMAAVGPSGVPNLELGKEAIIRSIEFLQPSDRAGIASFDTNGTWIADIQDVLDRQSLQRLVATLRPGGGTDIMAGMQLAQTDIVDEESERKHLILITDGGANERGLVELAEELFNTNGVTTSTIAIGAAAAGFLDDLAEAGGGNYHQVIDVTQIPKILALETVLATRSYIIEEDLQPVLTANHPIMDGIRGLPLLRGYVATTAKPTAQVILRGPEPFSDPLLASWQYGLGRVVAFTSDASARWAANWVQWEEFPRLWNNAISWTITEGAASNIETRVVMEDYQARVTVDARDSGGAFLNGLSLQLSLRSPEGEAALIPMQQIAPGQYEAVFTPSGEGAYYLAVNGSGEINGETLSFNNINGWVMSYSPEYMASATSGDALLARLAQITGGGTLEAAPENVFEHNLSVRTTAAPIWPWLLGLALALLPFDIAVRRLIITRSDLQRAWAFVRRGRPVPEERAQRLATLMDARERARMRVEEQSGGVSTIGALKERKIERSEAEAPPMSSATPVQPTVPHYSPPPPVPAGIHPNGEDDNIGSRLLKRRRPRGEESES